MKKVNARALMEGSALAAIMTILGLFYNVPFLDAVTMFWPVPIIIVGYRNGFRISILSALVAALLVSLIATPIVGAILFLTYALPGGVMGLMMRRKANPYYTLVVCGLMLSVTVVIQFVLGLELMLGTSIFDILGNFKASMEGFYNQIYSSIDAATDMYRKFGIDEATIQQLIDTFNQSIAWIKMVIPAVVISTGITVAFFNFKMVRLILGRIGYSIEDIKRFSQWSLNKRYRYIFLGATLILILLMSDKAQYLSGLYINVWILLMMAYAVLGLSVVVYYIGRLAEKYEMPKPVQGLIIAFIFMMMMGVLPYIGMFDIAADIRRFDRNIPGGVR